MMRFRTISHTADLGIQIFGKNEKQLFENSAYALFSLITDVKKIDERETRKIDIKSDSSEGLLVDWLRELLYLFSGEDFLVKRCDIKDTKEFSISSDISGEVFNPHKHRIKREIKAVTYHSAFIKKNKNRWFAQVIFDI